MLIIYAITKFLYEYKRFIDDCNVFKLEIIEKFWVEYLFILEQLELVFFSFDDGSIYLLEDISKDLLVKGLIIGMTLAHRWKLGWYKIDPHSNV